VYNRGARSLDSRPWRRRRPRAILMPMADPRTRRPGARAASDQPLVREVRWRLFRREDLPARLRRLERLEEVAAASPHRDGSEPGPRRGAR
jgi:hypothetical protein